MQPLVPIEVDEQTGIWTTDGLPMIYVPRHFFINNHQAVVNAVGREEYASHLYDAGYKSAYFWCENEAPRHNLSGMDVFHHYLNRLSQRGWGLIRLSEDDIGSGQLKVELQHSVFVLQYQKEHGDAPIAENQCFMFNGWLAGAADWVADNLGLDMKFSCEETQCAAQGHDLCVFTVSQIAKD